MIRIFYLTRARFLSERAHMHNIVKTCEFFENSGKARVSLIDCDSALKDNESIDNFFKFHSIKKRFEVISLDSLANRFKFRGVRILNFLEVFFTNLTLIRYLFERRRDFDLIYYRDHLFFPVVIFAKCFLKKPLFFESHYILKKRHSRLLTNFVIGISNGVIVITEALNKRLKKYNKNIITVFCAAPEFPVPEIHDRGRLRKDLKLPVEEIIVGYTGNMSVTGMNESYGVEEIVNSLKYLPDRFVFVGVGDKIGEARYLKELAKKDGFDERVIILPWMKREIIPQYLAAFDVLVVPRAGGAPGNVPTKIYEYLGTKKPIVACATEPNLEVMHDKENCLIVNSNSPQEWAEKIKAISNDEAMKEKIIRQAEEDSKIYTWENRAKLILDFIKSLYVEK